MDDAVHEIERDINGKLQWFKARIDLARNTKILAQPNVNKHVYVTIGDQVTMILHPHAARRLIKAMTAVLDGKDFDLG